MSRIISIHSFRGGTGKSNSTANIAALMAKRGLRVGVVDTDIQSPGVHVLFGVSEDKMGTTLNDYLWGRCDIEEAARDVTPNLAGDVSGKVFLVPSSIKASDITRILNEGYDVGLLQDGFQRLLEELDLDALIVDTHPGMNEETLLSIAISDSLIMIMRPDTQDFQGTAVALEVARKFDVPQMMLLVNKTPQVYDFDDVRTRVSRQYDCDVAAVLPHSDEMMALASEGVFVLRYPKHPIVAAYERVVDKLLA